MGMMQDITAIVILVLPTAVLPVRRHVPRRDTPIIDIIRI